jgi:hypothetical protein
VGIVFMGFIDIVLRKKINAYKMNKLIVLLLILSGITGHAQNKILFSYDLAGNQEKRELCVNCPLGTGKIVKDAKTLTNDDLIKSEVSDQISYYPNPVKQELYLSWILSNDITISSIQLYSLTGQLIQSFKNTDKINLQTIPFESYPRGVYAVVLVYSNGEQKTIKIIKQ